MNKTFKIALILLVAISILSSVLAALAFLGKEKEHLRRVLVEEKLASVLKDKQRIEKELEVVQKSKEEADSKIKELNGNIAKLSGEIEAEKGKADSALGQVREKQRQLLKITEDLQDEKKEKEVLAKRLSGLQGEHENTQRQFDRAKAEKAKLEKKVAELEQKTVELDKIVVKPQEPAVVRPLLCGKVLVVNKDYNFVVTDLGNDEGVSKGMLFDILRDGENLGRAEIDKIYESMSSATMIPGTRTLDVRKGDSVIEVRQ